jgi:hypothetical protein
MPVIIAKPKVPLTIVKPKPSAPPVSKQPGDVAKPMAAAAMVMSAGGKHVDNAKIEGMLNKGALDLYDNIQKGDAIDSMLAMLSVGITSASLDCLAQAALTSPGNLQVRNLNLGHAMKGAETVVKIIKALDNRRGAKSEKLTVGQVNVEAGGQAIVGNIESAPHPGASPTKPSKTD